MKKASRFIQHITALKMTTQRGPLADLKKAASKGTRYKAWETLATYGGLQDPEVMDAFSAIGSAYAMSSHITAEGSGNMGAALRKLVLHERSIPGRGNPVDYRFQRLLRCRTCTEICLHISPVLKLLASKGIRLDYVKALEDVLSWGEDVKLKWATSYYTTLDKE